MEDQVALDLLQRFLEKRGVDCRQLAGLVALGRVKSCFPTTDSLFEVGAWRNLGDMLWDLVIDDDKAAKKLMRPWREVINTMKRYQVERNLAAVASDKLGGSSENGPEHSEGVTGLERDSSLLFNNSRVPGPLCWGTVTVTRGKEEEDLERGQTRQESNKAEERSTSRDRPEQAETRTGRETGAAPGHRSGAGTPEAHGQTWRTPEHLRDVETLYTPT